MTGQRSGLVGDTARELVAWTVRHLRDKHLACHEGGILAINDGHCSDFANEVLAELHGRLASEAEESETRSFCLEDDGGDEVFDVALLAKHWPGTKPPAPLTWEDLNAIGLAYTAHIWIAHEGRHYDADVPDGVDSMLDLPIFRRNLVLCLEQHRPDLLAAVAGDPWWDETTQMRAELREWVEAGRGRSAGTAPGI